MKIKILAICVCLVIGYWLLVILSPDSSAQTSCGSTTTLRAEGLVSTPQIGSTSKFGTTGGCIIDPKAAFAPFKIPTFDELKSLYFDQSKANKIILTGFGLPSSYNGDTVYYRNGSAALNPTTPTGSGTQVFFINGHLPISSNYTYGHDDPGSGTVFIVKGEVNIHSTVTQIDAVIISEGPICTAYDVNSVSCPTTNLQSPQLNVYGSLISLTETAPIKFRRTLADNSQPAEKINHQVKYLVLLRHILSDTWQRWSEIP